MSFEITKSKLLKKYTTDNGVTDVIVPDEVAINRENSI